MISCSFISNKSNRRKLDIFLGKCRRLVALTYRRAVFCKAFAINIGHHEEIAADDCFLSFFFFALAVIRSVDMRSGDCGVNVDDKTYFGLSSLDCEIFCWLPAKLFLGKLNVAIKLTNRFERFAWIIIQEDGLPFWFICLPFRSKACSFVQLTAFGFH